MKSDVYFEGEGSLPLYRRVLDITVSGLCDMKLVMEEDTRNVILARDRASVRHGIFKLACSFKRGALTQLIPHADV